MKSAVEAVRKEAEKRVAAKVLEKSGNFVGERISGVWGVRLTKLSQRARKEG